MSIIHCPLCMTINKVDDDVKIIVCKKCKQKISKVNNDITLTDIGSRIKFIRKSYNLSYKELAKLSGLGEQTILNIENGKTDSGLKNIKKIANSLNVRLSVLIRENEIENRTDLSYVVEDILSLSNTDIKRLFNILKRKVKDL